MTAWVLESALRSLMMALVVWAGIKVLRVRNVAVQKTAWVLVLIASLAMPALMHWNVLQKKAPVVVPVSAPQILQAAPVAAHEVSANSEPAITILPAAFSDASAATHHWTLSDLQRLVVPAYLLVCGVLLLRLLAGWLMALRILYRSEEASVLLEPRASVRISDDIETPVTIARTVVLPESHEDWDLHKLRVVLAHERSHVRQGDFYLQLLAGLHVALFWFNPLSWWLKKEISDLGEAISDRAALAEAQSRATYAEVLVEFATLRRRPLAGVAMARSSNIRRRVDRLLVETKFRGAFTSRRWHAAAAAGLVPVALMMAVGLVRVQAAEAMVPAVAAPVVRAVTQTIAAVPPIHTRASVHAVPAVASALAAKAQEPQESAHVNQYTEDGGNSYAIVTGNSTSMMGSWHSGNSFDKVKSKMHGDYIWFERGGKDYVIDDPALVGQAKEYFAPVAKLGEQQGELGRQQGELGKEQARLGEMEANVSGPPPDLSKELAEVQLELKNMQAEKIDAQVKQVDLSNLQGKLSEMQAKLSAMQGKFGDAQAHLGAEQAKFGEQQAQLGEKQAELGQKQAVLGKRQAELSKEATQKMKSLMDSAMQSGKARPVE